MAVWILRPCWVVLEGPGGGSTMRPLPVPLAVSHGVETLVVIGVSKVDFTCHTHHISNVSLDIWDNRALKPAGIIYATIIMDCMTAEGY